MFHRRNYDTLEEACLRYTSRPEDPEAGDKSGLMISLYYLLIKAAKIIRVFYLVREETVKATETAEFLEVLSYNKNILIGGAIYNNIKFGLTNQGFRLCQMQRRSCLKIASSCIKQAKVSVILSQSWCHRI